ncbi:9778_t:CDS:2 [Racocetra persica]|uniref:9778_t:CDS:1 n=1 Tax=Racocetra persica TaxID=160502 RepID=A0ACA9MSH2_9GLOM|nr:9778_t:CDS:2 [Racocetra persica]
MSTISSSPLNRTTNQLGALQSNSSFQNNNSAYQKQQYICCWEGCDQRFNNAKDLIIHLKEIHIKILNIVSPLLFHCKWGDCKSEESTSTENLLNHESQMNQGVAVQNISESVQQQPDSQLELQLNQQNQRIEESKRVACAQTQRLQLDTVPPDSSRQVDTVVPKEIVIIDDDETTVDKPIQVANSVAATQQVTNNRMPVMREFDTRPRQMSQTLHYSHLPETQGHSVPSFNATSNQFPSRVVQVPSQRVQVPNQRVQVPNQRVQIPVQMGANTSQHNSNLRYHSAQQGNNIIRTSQQNYRTSGLPLMQTYQDGNVIRIIQGNEILRQENDILRQENENLKRELRNMMAIQEPQSKLKKENEQLIIELQNLKAKIAAQEAQPRQSDREKFLMVELRKLQTQLMLKESQLKMTEGELVYHKRVTNLITEQIRRSDTKMREYWVEMLREKGRTKHNSEKMTVEKASLKRTREENDMQDSITGAVQKRSKENEESSEEGTSEKSKDTRGIDDDNTNQEKMDAENMDVEPLEKPDSEEYDINIITEAYVCQWNGCKKVFRTKLALKAHIPSEHIAAECLRVHVDKPSVL